MTALWHRAPKMCTSPRMRGLVHLFVDRRSASEPRAPQNPKAVAMSFSTSALMAAVPPKITAVSMLAALALR